MRDPAQQRTTRCYSIHPIRDHLIALTDLAKWHQNRTGRSLHRTAAYRWSRSGINGMRLPTIQIGGISYTSEEALTWWATVLTNGEAR